ncbi:Uma2 family endonuclease [Nocardiopsis sp. FIRDI 009]|uniref:Uma2 family endonuclease n=1 Tax=Nocardiopsis sp. FIRDI 009 TaxID=714197 RepID=UPI001E3C2933|nr:Uma2 family endonuclease [Nocardiopsis sp. FIRDI 009]
MEAIPRERGWGLYQTLGIQVTTSGQVFMPDLVVIPRSALRGRTKPPCPAEKAFLAVEIVSPSSRNNDRTIKLRGYARAGVPLYLLIDAFNEVGPSVTLHEQPANGQYDRTTSVRFGDKIRLPDPFDTEIDTDEFPGLDEW